MVSGVSNHNEMSFVIALAGILGTLAMTIFVELVCYLFKKPYHVVRVLSRMLHFSSHVESKPKWVLLYCTALVLHYGIGILFSYAFYLLIKYGFMEPDLLHTIIFGSLAGLIGISGWRLFFAIHPNPLRLNLTQYLFVIWLGHLIFAIGTFMSYVELQSGSFTH
jgi:hypothetical protein